LGKAKPQGAVYRGPRSKPLFRFCVKSGLLGLLLFFLFHHFGGKPDAPEPTTAPESPSVRGDFSKLGPAEQTQLIARLKEDETSFLAWWSLSSPKDGNPKEVLTFLDAFNEKFAKLVEAAEAHEDPTHFNDSKAYEKDGRSCFQNLSTDLDRYVRKPEDVASGNSTLGDTLHNLTAFAFYKQSHELFVEDIEERNAPAEIRDLKRSIEGRLDRAAPPEGDPLERQTQKVFDAYETVARLILPRLEKLAGRKGGRD
tara:strand:- start:17 stop:781 length:765 start_codon:yes stop_codon:yes gene_type:complete